jgi:hypothetical protein
MISLQDYNTIQNAVDSLGNSTGELVIETKRVVKRATINKPFARVGACLFGRGRRQTTGGNAKGDRSE